MANTPAQNSRNSMRRLRAEVLERLGGACIECGLDDPRVLQIDHIHNDGAAERKSRGGSTLNRRYIRNELRAGRGFDRYQLLCANCHAIKSWRTDG